jgi:hypothetical protein
MNPRCFTCNHITVMRGRLVCYCASRTIRRGADGDACMSYLMREVNA